MTVPLRLLIVAAALVFTGYASVTRAKADETQVTTRATARTKAEPVAADSNNSPLGGLLIIAGIIGVIIVLAWVASRIGDSRRSDVAG